MNHSGKIFRWLASSALVFFSTTVFSSPSTDGFQKAQAIYQTGDWPEALTAFQNFEKQFPFSLALPEAIYYQGWCFANETNYLEAAATFQRLITGYTNHTLIAETMLKQAECYRELKNYPPAIDLYRKFQSRFPSHELFVQALLGEAWSEFLSGNLPAAKNIITTIRQHFPKNPATLDALFLLGQIFTTEKDFANAKQIRELIITQNAEPHASELLYRAGEALFARGEALLCAGNTNESRQIYSEAIEDYKGVHGDLLAPALLRLASCYQAMDQPEKSELEIENFKTKFPQSALLKSALLIQAEAQFSQKKYIAAIANYTEALTGAKDTVLIEFRIANANFNLKNFVKASADFKSFTTKYPDSKLRPDALFYLGLAQSELANNWNIIAAISTYEELRDKYPQFDRLPLVTFRLGYFYGFAGNYSKATACFQEFLHKWPNYNNFDGKLLAPEALSQIAGNYLAAEHYTDAMITYQTVVEKFPDFALPAAKLLAIGNVLLKAEKFELAMKTYQRAIAAAGTDQKVLTLANLGLGQALIGLRQFESAKTPLETALTDTKYCPRDESQFALAEVFEATGQPEKAIELYSSALNNPGEIATKAAFQLGNIYFNQKNKKLALAYYTRLLFATGPMADEATYRSAECQLAIGTTESARSAFQNYLKRFPDGKFAADAKTQLTKP